MKSSHSRVQVPLYGLLALAGVLGMNGCNQSEQPLVPGSASGNQPPESVARKSAPASRTDSITRKVNQYRAQTYGSETDVQHLSSLYTAAYRHAVYLNTINSSLVDTNNAGPSSNILTASTPMPVLQQEIALPPGVFRYPAYPTHATVTGRIAAIVGGPGAMAAVNPPYVMEGYVVNGNVPTTSGAEIYRGFNLDARTNATPSNYLFDEVDNLWYTRHGRVMLMRPSLRFIGYGGVNDEGLSSPYPFLDGRFRGVMKAMAQQPLVAQLGFWPNHNNRNVIPYGLDTDVGGPHQYCGPPIHITLPVAEPILRYPDNSFYFEFQKMEFDPETGAAQPAPADTLQLRMKVYSNVTGLSVGGVNTGLNPAYQYTVSGDAVPAVDDGGVTSITPGYQQPSATSTYQLSPIPTGFSLITFDASVDLSQVVPGDQVRLNVSNSGGYPYPNQFDGSYLVIWNSAAPISGQPSLPQNSLAVSYINGEELLNGEYRPSNIYANGGGAGTANPLPSIDVPGNNGTFPNTADIISTARARSSTVQDAQALYPLRDGEIMMVPTEPLEPNAWYEVRTRLRTASYVLEDATDPVGNPHRLIRWRFKTNALSNTIPPLY